MASQRISLQDLYSVPDILSTDAFYFMLTGLPSTVLPSNPYVTGVNQQNWMTTLALKVQNVMYPGFSNEKMTVPLASHQLNFRGRRMQPQSLTVSYYEDRTMATTQIFRQWHEFVVGTLSGVSGGYIAQGAGNTGGGGGGGYSTTATMQIFDTTGLLINKNNWYRVFPQDVPDITFDGSSTQAMIMSVTLSYDYSDDTLQPGTLQGGGTLSGSSTGIIGT